MPPDAAAPDAPDTAVREASDVGKKNGMMVEVFGTYQQVAADKAPDATPRGHAAVRLDDGTLVYLEPPWHPEAIRSADEIAKYEGKPVVAKGVLFAECLPPPDGRAYAKVPCLGLGILLLDRPTYNALQTGRLD